MRRTLKTTTTPGRFIDRARGNPQPTRPRTPTPTTARPKATATRRAWSAATSWKFPTTRAPSGTTFGCSPKSSTKANSRSPRRSVTPATPPTTRRLPPGLPQPLPRHPWDVFYRPALEHPKPRARQPDRHGHRPKGEEIHCDQIRPHQGADSTGTAKVWRIQQPAAGCESRAAGPATVMAPSPSRVSVWKSSSPSSKAILTSPWSPVACTTRKTSFPTTCRRTKPAACSKPSAHRAAGGFNELRIEDKKGAEQIFIHAQRDWDENVEHDQKIRVGNERHDTVEKNTYTELKAEEHRTTIADRKVEVKAERSLGDWPKPAHQTGYRAIDEGR